MFHFGLFSSFLPYIVIAAIYFCGLASYSVEIVNTHLSNKQDSTYFSEDYGVQISTDEINQDICYNLSIYRKHSPENKTVTHEVENLYMYVVKSGKELNGYYYKLFSRPPPYLS